MAAFHNSHAVQAVAEFVKKVTKIAHFLNRDGAVRTFLIMTSVTKMINVPLM